MPLQCRNKIGANIDIQFYMSLFQCVCVYAFDRAVCVVLWRHRLNVLLRHRFNVLLRHRLNVLLRHRFNVYYRMAKTHGMPYLHRSLFAKEPYN